VDRAWVRVGRKSSLDVLLELDDERVGGVCPGPQGDECLDHLAAQLVVSSVHKTNDPNPAENYCEISAQAVGPGGESR